MESDCVDGIWTENLRGLKILGNLGWEDICTASNSKYKTASPTTIKSYHSFRSPIPHPHCRRLQLYTQLRARSLSITVSLFPRIQMPLKHLPKNALPPTLNHIPMTRYDPIEIPPLNLPHTLIKPRPIARARHIPIKSLLPDRRPLRPHQTDKHPRQQPRRRRLPGPRILLVRRQIEQQIRLDQRAVRAVIENEFAVRVRVDVLVVEVGVEFRIDLEVVLVLGREDVLEAGARGFGALGAFFGEAVGTQELGGGEGGGPLGEEDVVFEVGRDEVFDGAGEGGEGLLDFGR